MATTTNYGWTTPNDTDLVKDGAAAIRTLGSSIDTTTKALNPSTTLGDIEYRSATANTNTRLPIGTNGQYLTVSSGVPAWGAISAGGMTLLSTTSLSGTKTTISSIDQTYTNLQIIVRGFRSTSAQSVYIRPNDVNNTCIFTGGRTDGGYPGGEENIQSTPMQTTAVSNAWVINIHQYSNTTNWKPINHFGTSKTDYGNTWSYGGTALLTSAITSISLESNGAGTFSGGTVLIYGVK
jgi:hypothetical protein